MVPVTVSNLTWDRFCHPIQQKENWYRWMESTMRHLLVPWTDRKKWFMRKYDELLSSATSSLWNMCGRRKSCSKISWLTNGRSISIRFCCIRSIATDFTTIIRLVVMEALGWIDCCLGEQQEFELGVAGNVTVVHPSIIIHDALAIPWAVHLLYDHAL